MTAMTCPSRPSTTRIELLAQFRRALDDLTRDVDTLLQIEQIQQQHQVVLTSAEAIADRLNSQVTALQQSLTRLDYHTAPKARTSAQ